MPGVRDIRFVAFISRPGLLFYEDLGLTTDFWTNLTRFPYSAFYLAPMRSLMLMLRT